MNTTRPRIAPRPLPLPPDLAERMARLLPAGMPPPQIFLTVARHGELFKEMVDSGWLGPTGLADRKRLAPALREALILRLVDGLVTRIDVDDATWVSLREHFDEAALLEMTQLVGHYTGVAMLAALARPALDRYR